MRLQKAEQEQEGTPLLSEDDEYAYDEDNYYEDEDHEEEVLSSDDDDDVEENDDVEEDENEDEDYNVEDHHHRDNIEDHHDNVEEDEDENDEDYNVEDHHHRDNIEDHHDNVEEKEHPYSNLLVPGSSDSPYMVIHRDNVEEEEEHHISLHTFYSISKETYYRRLVIQMYGKICRASYNDGWLILLDTYLHRFSQCYYLWNPTATLSLSEMIKLPLIKTSYSCDYCILTSSPPDCVVMFLSFEDNSCLFCRPNDQRWTKKHLGPKPDGVSSKSFQQLFGAVSCKGKIYINYGYGQGMKILDYKTHDTHSTDHHRFTVEKIKFNSRGLMDSFGSFIAESQTSQYLVESCGEVFLVVRIYIGSSNLNTHSFSVYKLMNSSSTSTSKGDRIAWKRVDSLGDDRVFFVAQRCSLSASASKAGLMENYIYFFHPCDPRYFCRFSMNTGSIYKSRRFPMFVDAPRNEPYWMMGMNHIG